MLLPVVGLDRRLINKKDGSGKWAIVLCKLESGDVAEIFLDSKNCADFAVGQQLALEADLSVFDKKLGIRPNSLNIAK